MADRRQTGGDSGRGRMADEPLAGTPRAEQERGIQDDSHGRSAETTEQARQTMTEVREEAGQKARELQAQAERRADRWTDGASHHASSIAHALRVAGRDLDEHGENRIAHWSESAADEVDKMAGYLEQEDPRSMLEDVQQFARRNPGAFVGGTFAAGLLLGRFLRSSPPEDDRTGREDQSRRA